VPAYSDVAGFFDTWSEYAQRAPVTEIMNFIKITNIY